MWTLALGVLLPWGRGAFLRTHTKTSYLVPLWWYYGDLCLLSCFYVPCTVLNTWHVLLHLIIMGTICSIYCDRLHFAGEADRLICPGFPYTDMWELGLGSEPELITLYMLPLYRNCKETYWVSRKKNNQEQLMFTFTKLWHLQGRKEFSNPSNLILLFDIESLINGWVERRIQIISFLGQHPSHLVEIITLFVLMYTRHWISHFTSWISHVPIYKMGRWTNWILRVFSDEIQFV